MIYKLGVFSLLLFGLGSVVLGQEVITVKGSDTMVILAQRWPSGIWSRTLK